MPELTEAPPYSRIEVVTDVLHGVPVADPYRWLEEQESPHTREWLQAQKLYSRSCLDSLPGRGRIRERIRELLDIETYDSLQKAGDRYFFRKRLLGQEQPCICFREDLDGSDQVLIDPASRGTGPHTAVKPLRISPDGRLLLYEVKEGGERTGTFELLHIETRKILADVLPRGYLRGFAFAPDSRSFYYVHEAVNAKRPQRLAAYQHMVGTDFKEDKEIFLAGDNENIRLHIVPGQHQIGFLVFRFLDRTYTDFYLWTMGSVEAPESVIRNAEYTFGPLLHKTGRILAVTDHESPNLRIVEVRRQIATEPEFADVIPSSDVRILNWVVGEERVFVSYLRDLKVRVEIFDLDGVRLGELPLEERETVRLIGAADAGDEVFFEQESFTKPTRI